MEGNNTPLMGSAEFDQSQHPMEYQFDLPALMCSGAMHQAVSGDNT